MNHPVLTERDLELLDFVATNRAAPLDLLAAKFFAWRLGSDVPTLDAENACERRIHVLVDAGHLRTRCVKDGSKDRAAATKVVYVTPRTARMLGARKPRPLPARNRVHHLATLRAIEVLRQKAGQRGARVVGIKLEGELRSQAQRGRRTRKGQEYESFPDAVVTIERVRSDGTTEQIEVALEYVTSKYADKDIAEKARAFQTYDRTLWVADKPLTSARVQRLTGERCACL